MKQRAALLATLVLWISAPLCAQVRVDHAIHLEGATPQDRQLHGAEESTSPQAVLTAGVEGSGAHRFAIAGAGPVWVVDLPSLETSPVEGLHLLVRSDTIGTGPLSITVNGNGPYPITRGPSSPVQTEDIPTGTVLSLVFDGVVFQVMNGTAHSMRDCPAGMLQASAQFCMEGTERAPAEFFAAALTCAELGYRLCTWGEFIVGCENAATLGLQQMTGNYEWTNNAANEDNCARIAGSSNCRQAAVSLVSDPRNFRCCLTR